MRIQVIGLLSELQERNGKAQMGVVLAGRVVALDRGLAQDENLRTRWGMSFALARRALLQEGSVGLARAIKTVADREWKEAQCSSFPDSYRDRVYYLHGICQLILTETLEITEKIKHAKKLKTKNLRRSH